VFISAKDPTNYIRCRTYELIGAFNLRILAVGGLQAIEPRPPRAKESFD